MDSGSIGFVMICAAFVFFMTPGLSYFYGGLVRRKMPSTQCLLLSSPSGQAL